jgi:glycosyltransferase involved in cell wall biosynthesis
MAEQTTSSGASLDRPTLSVAIITLNEEANIRRTLESVKWADEIVIVDSGSTDRTCEIAREYGAKVFVEPWKGFAAQKNSALDKCTSDWILSLDADEEVSAELTDELGRKFRSIPAVVEEASRIRANDSLDTVELVMALEEQLGEGNADLLRAASVPRKNFFLGRWIKHGGFYPDRKVRLIRYRSGRFADRRVHEDIEVKGLHAELESPLIHHAYPTLTSYIEHMNRYSSLGAEMVVEKRGRVGFSFVNILLRPWATFVYNYFLRLGFLDGKEGLLLHLYHAVYVSWKYAKAWELSRNERKTN